MLEASAALDWVDHIPDYSQATQHLPKAQVLFVFPAAEWPWSPEMPFSFLQPSLPPCLPQALSVALQCMTWEQGSNLTCLEHFLWDTENLQQQLHGVQRLEVTDPTLNQILGSSALNSCKGKGTSELFCLRQHCCCPTTVQRNKRRKRIQLIRTHWEMWRCTAFSLSFAVRPIVHLQWKASLVTGTELRFLWIEV